MPAELDKALDGLNALREEARILTKSCRRDGSGVYSNVTAELQTLIDAVYDLSLSLCSKEFWSRQDAHLVCNDIDALVADAEVDIDALRPLLPPSSTSSSTYGSRTPSPLNSDRLLDMEDKIHIHARSLHRQLDRVQNREDWSGLSPKPPKLPESAQSKTPETPKLEKSKDRLKVSTKTVSFSPGSAPPSPYMEDAQDIEDEDDHGVKHFHMTPPAVIADPNVAKPQAELSSSDRKNLSAGSLKGKGQDGKDSKPANPPKMVLRQPTDPDGLRPDDQSLNEEDPPIYDSSRLRKSPAQSMSPSPKASPSTHLVNHPDQTVQGPGSSQRNSPSIQEIRAEIARLAALEAHVLKSSPLDDDERRPGHHRSYSHGADVGAKQDDSSSLPLPKAGRPRSSTVGNLQADGAFLAARLGNNYGDDGQRARTPKVSPYMSPRPTPPLTYDDQPSPSVPKIPYSQRGRVGRQKRESLYGLDPGKSLPDGLEYGHRDATPDRNRSKRGSWANADEDWELFGADRSHRGPMSPPGPSIPLSPPTSAGRDRPSSSSQKVSSSPRSDAPSGVTMKELPVSLEDLCTGATKHVRFRRRVWDSRTGRLVDEEKLLEVPVYAGLKPGSKIKFRNEGNVVLSSSSSSLSLYDRTPPSRGELWFVLNQIPHAVFTRRDDADLVSTLEIPIADALCGWQRALTSICGRTVKVASDAPTGNTFTEVFPGLGMPKYKSGVRGSELPRGDWVVEVKVVWPARLDDWQREMVRKALGDSSRGGSSTGSGR